MSDTPKPTDFVYIQSDSMTYRHLFGWFWWVTKGKIPYRPNWVWKIGRLLITVKPRIMLFGGHEDNHRLVEIPYEE